jgi:hypothetical protein
MRTRSQTSTRVAAFILSLLFFGQARPAIAADDPPKEEPAKKDEAPKKDDEGKAADEPKKAKDEPKVTLKPEDRIGDPKREKQDYGAPNETSAEEVLLWGPRVVLFPLWVISEFVIRRPIGAITKTAEKEQIPQEIVDFFTFGSRKQFTIFPSAFFDFGLLPSVGFNAKWKYFLTDPNTLLARGLRVL